MQFRRIPRPPFFVIPKENLRSPLPSGPKARPITAQGEALGWVHHTSPRAVGPTHAVPPSPPASAPNPPHPPPINGERKHGPNPHIDETHPVVCIATKDPAYPSSALKYEKTLSNIQEVTARSGRVIAIAIEGDDAIAQPVEHVIHILRHRVTITYPRSCLFAVAGLSHRRPTRMRRRPAPNLVKSVTVE